MVQMLVYKVDSFLHSFLHEFIGLHIHLQIFEDLLYSRHSNYWVCNVNKRDTLLQEADTLVGDKRI